MERVRFILLILLLVFTPLALAFSEVCLYGLGGFGSSLEACRALEREALQRVASAKTICYSANGQVQWSKNNKEPAGAFNAIRLGARSAMRGFTPLYGCEHSDLVVRIDYDDTSQVVTLGVTDAESGDRVFKEERSVSDLSSDVSRIASHFQSMLREARAAASAEREVAQAKARRDVFLANLPRHWHHAKECPASEATPCPQGSAVDVWIQGDYLYETASSGGESAGNRPVKREVSCAVKRGADEVTPWAGECIYKLFWNDESAPTCTVKTDETVTSIAAAEIAGFSQRVDYSPLHQTPPACPVPSAETRGFTFSPGRREKMTSHRFGFIPYESWWLLIAKYISHPYWAPA